MNKRFARLSEITSTKIRSGRYPVSPATWWRWVKLGLVPAPVKLGPNVSAWDISLLDEMDAAKAAGGQSI